MVLFNAAENKSELLRFDSEMEFNINEYRKQFMQEDTMAGMIQGWLDSYDGNYVCSIQLWKNAFNHYDGEPKKFETNEICQIMDTQIIGWKRGGYHRFTKEGYGKQRCWIRGDADGGNNEGGEGFIDLSEAEQMALPFN